MRIDDENRQGRACERERERQHDVFLAAALYILTPCPASPPAPRPSINSTKLQVVARVEPRRGDILVFPHGKFPGCHPDPLHEGSRITRGEKLLIRTDVVFAAPPPRGAKGAKGAASASTKKKKSGRQKKTRKATGSGDGEGGGEGAGAEHVVEKLAE